MENITILNALSYAIYLCNKKQASEEDKLLYCLDSPKKAEDIPYNRHLYKYIRNGSIIRNPDMTYQRNTDLKHLPERIPSQLRKIFPDTSDTDVYYHAVFLLDELCPFGTRLLTRYIILRYIQILPDIDYLALSRIIPSRHQNNIKLITITLHSEGLISMSGAKERPNLRISKAGCVILEQVISELDKKNLEYLLPLTELLKIKT